MRNVEYSWFLLVGAIFTAGKVTGNTEECNGIQVTSGGYGSKENPNCYTDWDCMKTLQILEPLFLEASDHLTTVDFDKISEAARDKASELLNILGPYEVHQMEGCEDVQEAQKEFSWILKDLKRIREKYENNDHLQYVFPTEYQNMAEKLDSIRVDVTTKLLNAFDILN